MSEDKKDSTGSKGYMVVVGALIIQICLGAIYSWSVFTTPLKAAGWETSQTQWPFTVGLVTFALVMVFAGRNLHKFGPRKLAIAGGLLLGLGYIIAGITGGTGFLPVLLGVGLMGGAGIGLGYVVPIAVGMQWFPDKKGLITGIAVAGFGLGAMIWVKLAGAMGHLIETYGIGNTFIIYGIAFAVLVSLGSIWMKFPEGFEPPAPNAIGGEKDFNSSEMVRTTQYWSILATFAIGATAGLMCIGLMKLFPSQALANAGIPAEQASKIAGTAMVVFAFANALGRIGWGKMSDTFGHIAKDDYMGRKLSIATMMASQGVFVAAFPMIAGSEYLLYLFAALIGFNFGGNFALFPTVTTDVFGPKFFGQNYGLVFLAYGLGGTIGPMLGGYLGNMGNFSLAFTITGVMSVLAAVIISFVKVPVKKSGQSRADSPAEEVKEAA